jgi:hypothetical protein
MQKYNRIFIETEKLNILEHHENPCLFLQWI